MLIWYFYYMETIILASGSERRQDFFRLLGLPFISMPPMIDETLSKGINPEQAVKELALKKTNAIINKTNKQPEIQEVKWVFGADTVVLLEGVIYGKPVDRNDARLMLGKLSGKRHEVITAMALYNGRTKTTDCRPVSCDVEFASLSASEIEWYLDKGEWNGAAGSYQLQGMGGCFIKSITGSPSNVVGLPLRDFYDMLRDNDYPYGG